MPMFRYTAVDASGTVIKGVLEGESRAAIVERLQEEGNLPLRADPADRRGALLDFLDFKPMQRRGLSKQEVAAFTRELSIMLRAGQDLDHALRFIVEITDAPRAKAIFVDIRDKVRGGATLATALTGHSTSFTQLYVGMVRAGELDGALAETLDRLAGLLEREVVTSASIRAALIYPALLVVAAVVLIIFLLTYVLPQFTPIFEQAGAKLPTATRALIGLGDFVRDNGLWVVILLLIGVAVGRRALTRPSLRLKFDSLILKVPGFGQLARETQAAYFTRTLGTLLRNGVPLLAALTVARDVLGNLAARAAVDAAQASAKQGAGVARSLEASGVFPPRMVHLLRLGEETGRLAEMALRAADIHDELVRIGLQRVSSLIVPVVTIATGLMVAGIIASLVTAMLSLNDLAL